MKHFLSFLILGVLAAGIIGCTGNSKCNQPVTKIVVTAAVEIKPEKAQQFKESLGALVTASRAEAGCISYSTYQCMVTDNNFFFFEEWKDQAAIDAHFAAPHFKSFAAMLDTMASKPAEIKQLEVIAEK